MKTRQKFLSDYWDSMQQRNLFNLLDENHKIQNLLIGRLRFDTLLSENLILTDAMLMDGQFFLFSDPLTLKEDILRSDNDNCPIIIKARKKRIEDATVGFIKNDAKKEIKKFSFSIINEDKHREYITNSMHNLNYSSINSISDIISFFLDRGMSGFDNVNFDRIKTGWNKWIRACNDNAYIVSEWRGDFDLINQLGNKSEVSKKYSTETAIELVQEIYENIFTRTEIEKNVNEKYNQATNENEKKEILEIASWYFSSYNCTINNQHGCDSFESIYSTTDYILTPGKDLIKEDSIQIPVDFCEGLGALPRGEYRNIFYENNIHFKRWWNEGDKDSLKRGLDPFIDISLKHRGLLSEPSEKLKRTILISVGGVTGALGWALGRWLGAAIGIGIARSALPLLIDYYQTYKMKKPIKNVSQRIMDIVDERDINDTENKNY